jgi:uncharacterized membrane protein (UPF0127 family)
MSKRTRRSVLASLLVVVILLVGAAAVFFVTRQQPSGIKFGTGQLELQEVSSPEALEKGLSGRQSMPESAGLLFVFPKAGEHCFWMKDMHFPIDMIWLDANKKVVTVKADVQPDTYPQSFCPTQPARYVIEVNAGVAKKSRISEGSQLRF